MKLTSLGWMPLLLLPFACASVDTQVHSDGSHAKHDAQAGAEAAHQHGNEAWDPFESRHAIDAQQRAEIFGNLKALEGRWTSENGETVFEVTSNGSVIRETMMPGQPMEMVNMYSMDGNDICMTHFCAGGNQPHMRAAGMQDQTLAFEPDGVSDLKEGDQTYMGSMTLKWIDEDTIEQHWYSHSVEGVSGPMVFQYKRAE